MQVLLAGNHKLLFLELDPDTAAGVARQAGFECKVIDGKRALTLEVSAPGRQAPLLLFDAADPGNLGWFSRCQFYIDGRSGSVLQTPLLVANVRDRFGTLQSNAIRVQLFRELPPTFRLPGKNPVSEQMVYAVLYNFLSALLGSGVGVCGADSVRPLAGRSEALGARN
jgi:hypothetical protein